MKYKNFLIFILSLSLFSSCGYFSDDVVEDSELYKSESLSAGCEIDTEELSQILEKDVEVQINCLEENLEKFAKYVKREDSNSITDRELSSFIRRFFSGHSALLVGSIRLMFDISGLVLSDNSSSLKTENIKPLFELLRIINKKLIGLMEILENFDESQGDLSQTSNDIKVELSSLVEEMKRLIEVSLRNSATELDLKKFIVSIKTQFNVDLIDVELIDTLLSFKKLFLGGDREVLTQAELIDFLDMAPDFGAIAFRLIKSAQDEDTSKAELYSLYKDQVKIIESFIYSHRRDEVIISRDDILTLTKSFVDEDGISIESGQRTTKVTLSDMMKISDSLKRNILGKNINPTEYTFQEVFNFIRVLESTLGLLAVNEKYHSIVKTKISSDYWSSAKASFIHSINEFKENMIQSWSNNKLFPDYMQPVVFINDVIELVAEDFEYNKIFSDSLGIAKVMLVGGNRYQLKQGQLVEILFKLEGLANISFDFLNANNDNHTEDEILKLRFEEFKLFKELLDDNIFLHVATIEEILEIGAKVLNNSAITSYRSTAEDLKKKLLGGYQATLTLKDLKSVMNYIIDFYGQRYFGSISFDLYEKELYSKEQISSFNYTRTHDDFKLYNSSDLKSYKDDFIRKVANLRLYRTKDGYQYYGNDFLRTKFGLLEHYMVSFAFDLLGKVFGHENEKGELELSLSELNDLLFSFKPILSEYGLWSAYPETFARNTLLLADLFQVNSNGSVSIDALEVAEYGTVALFAIKIADELIEKTKKYCEVFTKEDLTGFSGECYREHFFKVFLNELSMSDYLPKLNRYIVESSDEETLEYLLAIEGFAKDHAGPGLPQTRRDMVLLIGAMLNIESTFLRYDINDSNLLEMNELENGFPVYEEAIINLAELGDDKRKFAESIFFYMIEKMEQPSQVDLMLYHYKPFGYGDIVSRRLNIGALLYNMVVGSSDEE